MKNVTLRSRVFGILIAAAAVLAMGLLPLQSRTATARRTSISSAPSIQVADGTESNGGKGGKGSKRANYA